jgi:hypothetical protein
LVLRGQPVCIAKPDARIIDIETHRQSRAEHNRVVGNVFYGFETRGPELPPDGENASDCNGTTAYRRAVSNTSPHRHGEVMGDSSLRV